jgi:hypothetical protein
MHNATQSVSYSNMRDKIKVAAPNCSAEKVRVIAEGIFDNGERATVLEFVDECEKATRAQKGKFPARSGARAVR